MLLSTAVVAHGRSGPFITTPPYLVPATGIEFTAILTVGDEVRHQGQPAYRMVSIPDGLGAYNNGDGSFTVLMNHELKGNAGSVR